MDRARAEESKAPVGSSNDNVLSEARNLVEVVGVSADNAHHTARLVEAQMHPLHGGCLDDHPSVHCSCLHKPMTVSQTTIVIQLQPKTVARLAKCRSAQVNDYYSTTDVIVPWGPEQMQDLVRSGSTWRQKYVKSILCIRRFIKTHLNGQVNALVL